MSHVFTVVNNAVKLSVPLPVGLVLKLYNVFIGHSAKFGSYTVMDLKTNTVIDVQLVQVSCPLQLPFIHYNLQYLLMWHLLLIDTCI